ncbi:MAG TPA: host attachment protein, partial [Pseudomonadales bacterium]|nr:host attachment protein [Pseudomonadales bacterium]
HHEQELVSDAPGRSSSPGHSYSHPMGGEQDARQHNLEQFAKLLVNEVNRQLDSQQQPKLYLIAPPKFLGVLRSHLTDRIQKLIVGELDKNITDISPAKLSAYVKEMESVM